MMTREQSKVYVISHILDKSVEPTVTVFDNRKAAQKMYNYLKDQGITVWIDRCSIYHEYHVFE